jgi:alpha-beta hydrolase superfamily lysophospholipase
MRNGSSSNSIQERYAGLAFLDAPGIRAFVFHPRRDFSLSPSGPNIQEHLYPVEKGVVIGARFYPAGSKAPTIVYFHGNGEIAGDYDGIAPLYTERGINLLVADYRGYGHSTGTPSLTAMLGDAETVFSAAGSRLQAEGYEGERWIMGRSLGSASALAVAESAGVEVGGVIIESGFADALALLHRIGVPVRPTSQAEAENAQFNVRAIGRVAVPTLIIHGEDDQIIPVAEGRRLYEASSAGRKELLVIPQAGHNDLMWRDTEGYMRAIERFVCGR